MTFALSHMSGASMTMANYKVNLVDGIPFPPFVDQRRIDELREFKLYPDDLFVVTYPKSGTTWLQQIVKLIRNGGIEDGRRCNRVVPWLEADGRQVGSSSGWNSSEDDSSSSGLRSFSSHTPYHLMAGGPPHSSPAKYIYVARNPKDVAVSFYYHAIAFKAFEFSGDWNDFYKLFVSGRVDSGLWFDHVLQWWKHRSESNVLFIKYEDMKKELCALVKQVADFMGYCLTHEVVQSIADQCSFLGMKENNSSNFSWVPDEARSSSATPHLRKGTVGDWKSHFTSRQNEEFDALYEQKMEGTGLNFDFYLK